MCVSLITVSLYYTDSTEFVGFFMKPWNLNHDFNLSQRLLCIYFLLLYVSGINQGHQSIVTDVKWLLHTQFVTQRTMQTLILRKYCKLTSDAIIILMQSLYNLQQPSLHLRWRYVEGSNPKTSFGFYILHNLNRFYTSFRYKIFFAFRLG